MSMSSMFCKKIYICKNSGWCARDFNPEVDDPECFELMTNYDLVMRMGIEELAAWIADHPVVSEYDENNPQHKAWLDWLKQEVAE